jgi:hypothetical protein
MNIIEENIKTPKPKPLEDIVEILKKLKSDPLPPETSEYLSRYFLETLGDSERNAWYQKGYTEAQDARFDERPENRYSVQDWSFPENREAYIQGWNDAKGDLYD